MEWYSSKQASGPELEQMLLEYEDGKGATTGWPRPTLGPTTPKNWPKLAPTRPKLPNRRIS